MWWCVAKLVIKDTITVDKRSVNRCCTFYHADVLKLAVTLGGKLNMRLTLFDILSQIFLDLLNMNLWWTAEEHFTNYRNRESIIKKKNWNILSGSSTILSVEIRFLFLATSLIRDLCLYRYISADVLSFINYSYMLYFNGYFEVRIHSV